MDSGTYGRPAPPAAPPAGGPAVIHTPDRRVRVFVSSTLGELKEERAAVRAAIESLRLVPVMFELGARPHPPRELYRAYLRQSDVFLGVYGESYGWVAPGEEVSGLEDELRLAGERPRLLYVRTPAPRREPRLQRLLRDLAEHEVASYKRFASAEELADLVRTDLAVLLSESFAAAHRPEAADAAPPGTAVPAPATRTLGRDALLARLEEQIEGARLVTLTGPGGIGKTRVAVEIARRRQRRGGEVLYVGLADSADVPHALRAVEAAAGGHVDGAGSVLDSIVVRLAGRPLLLCLDNLEQVDAAGEAVAALLERLPALTVLATSRRALRVRAEQEVRVGPLDVPAAGAQQVAGSAAVELFVARARAVDERFALTADNAADVAEIARRLDGLPLAIELAAARMRILSPREVLVRLEDAFALLVGGGADLPARQRTLHATLDWSHALLTDREQAVFARLSGLAGSWTLAAAEAVCGDDGTLLEAVTGLVDKSLVVAERGEAGGVPRFRLLGTVRAYAARRLEERGETALVRDRLLEHVCALGRSAAPSLCGPGQREWLARLDPEVPSVREAVEHALATGRLAETVQLAWDLTVHFIVRNAEAELDAWLARVQRSREVLDEVARARLDVMHAVVRAGRAADPRTASVLDEALRVFRSEGMDFEVAVALHTRGFVLLALGHDAVAAAEALRESSARFATVGHDWGVSLAEMKLGSVLAAAGAHEQARAHLEVSLAHARRIACESAEVQALVQLAFLQVACGDWPGAAGSLGAAAAPLRRGRYLSDAAMALDAAAAVALRAERPDLARAAARAAARTRDRLGTAPWPTWASLVASVRERVQAAGAAAQQDRPEEVVDPFAVLDQVLDQVAGAPAVGQASAFALSRSNSAWSIAPESRSALALEICAAGSGSAEEPATCLM